MHYGVHPHSFKRDQFAPRQSTPEYLVALFQNGARVQVLIHVHPGDRPGEKCYELVDCGIDTSIRELKQKVEEIGSTSGRFSLHCDSQELVFMGERCLDSRLLRDYGICHEFIKQVTGFVINPEKPGQKFVEGRLVPYEQQ